jgi:hypothetical protein
VSGLRQHTPGPAERAARDRAEASETAAERRRADRYAASFGPCSTCKVDVGADGVHRWSCTTVSTERRANRGRAPKCTGFRCGDDGTNDTADFGPLCDHHLSLASDTVGT